MAVKGGRQPAKNVSEKPCEICGEVFMPYRAPQRACSRVCGRKLPPHDSATGKPVEFTCERCERTTVRHTGPIGGSKFRYCADCKPLVVAETQRRKYMKRLTAPERSALNRKYALKKYGLTPEQHDQMLESQGGRCAICREEPNPEGVRAASRLHVDHDHQTGKVRALLCTRCNQGLGYFRDRTDLLAIAAEYLERFQDEPVAGIKPLSLVGEGYVIGMSRTRPNIFGRTHREG